MDSAAASRPRTTDRPEGVIAIANYYISYADHMWRFYIRHMDADIAEMSTVSRANWSACHSVYATLNQTARHYIRIYYGTAWSDANTAVQTWCADHGADPAVAWRIIRAAQNRVAEVRGLIDTYSDYQLHRIQYNGTIKTDTKTVAEMTGHVNQTEE